MNMRAATGARRIPFLLTSPVGAVLMNWLNTIASSCTRSWKKLSANDPKRSPVQQKIGDMYESCMDESCGQ